MNPTNLRFVRHSSATARSQVEWMLLLWVFIVMRHLLLEHTGRPNSNSSSRLIMLLPQVVTVGVMPLEGLLSCRSSISRLLWRRCRRLGRDRLMPAIETSPLMRVGGATAC